MHGELFASDAEITDLLNRILKWSKKSKPTMQASVEPGPVLLECDGEWRRLKMIDDTHYHLANGLAFIVKQEQELREGRSPAVSAKQLASLTDQSAGMIAKEFVGVPALGRKVRQWEWVNVREKILVRFVNVIMHRFLVALEEVCHGEQHRKAIRPAFSERRPGFDGDDEVFQ